MRGTYCTVMFGCFPSLHQILQREGITHDHFMCQIVFILVFVVLSASGCIACIRSLLFVNITLHCIIFTTLTVNIILYICAWACEHLVADETQGVGCSGGGGGNSSR